METLPPDYEETLRTALGSRFSTVKNKRANEILDHLVRCANSHADLLAALEAIVAYDCRLGAGLLAQARAAIARATAPL